MSYLSLVNASNIIRIYSSSRWSCLLIKAFFLLTRVNHSWISFSSSSLSLPVKQIIMKYHAAFQELTWNQLNSFFLCEFVSYPSPWAFWAFSPRHQLFCLCASVRFPGPGVHSTHTDLCPADTGQEVPQGEPQGDIHKTRQESIADREREKESENGWKWGGREMMHKDNGEKRKGLIFLETRKFKGVVCKNGN